MITTKRVLIVASMAVMAVVVPPKYSVRVGIIAVTSTRV